MKEHIIKNLPEGHPWQDRIFFYECLDSTNLLAKKMAAEGATEGTVVLADQQTAGRGRLGRSFDSPAGQGIYMSVILRPGVAPQKLMHLTCAVAVAVCDAVETVCGFRPGIKWINDLVAGRKKLAGILTELALDPKTGLVSYAIVGIGINCSQAAFPSELENIACSLKTVTGKAVDRAKLAAAVIDELSKLDLNAKETLLARYRQDCVTLGAQVTVIRGDERRRGTALDMDSDGGLTVRFEEGSLETVSSGEVSVRGLFGYS